MLRLAYAISPLILATSLTDNACRLATIEVFKPGFCHCVITLIIRLLPLLRCAAPLRYYASCYASWLSRHTRRLRYDARRGARLRHDDTRVNGDDTLMLRATLALRCCCEGYRLRHYYTYGYVRRYGSRRVIRHYIHTLPHIAKMLFAMILPILPHAGRPMRYAATWILRRRHTMILALAARCYLRAYFSRHALLAITLTPPHTPPPLASYAAYQRYAI